MITSEESKKQMKKLALVTCYFQPNYGSQLQAFATQKAFDKLGVANETICFDGIRLEVNKAKYRYFLSRIWDINTVKDKMATIRKKIALKLHNDVKANNAIRDAKFREFASTKFHLSRRFDGKADLRGHADEYSAFLVGSDQLWLPSNIEGDYYTLNFVPPSIPKIAYATSFGISKLPCAQAAKTKAFLPRIEFCSVREASGQKLVKSLIGKEVPVVCDPTLLFDADEWSKEIPSDRILKEPYIFVYFLGNNLNQRDFVKKVCAITGFKIVQMQHCDEFVKSDVGFPDYAPYDVGPFDFVRFVRDAEYVFTDSFHCSVFSVLHKKKFFTFRRYKSDGLVSTNGRLYSLLESVGLKDRLIDSSVDIERVLAMESDFDAAHNRLAALRESSWKFIINALDKIGTTHD
jgi:hypothetical protein